MAVIYSQTAINARLNGVISAIGVNGRLRLLKAGGLIVASIPLANPCGVVAGGVLTFTVPQSDFGAVGGGNATAARMEDALGNIMISGFTVGIPFSGADIIISNGLNSTLIQPGQVVTMLSGQIIGS